MGYLEDLRRREAERLADVERQQSVDQESRLHREEIASKGRTFAHFSGLTEAIHLTVRTHQDRFFRPSVKEEIDEKAEEYKIVYQWEQLTKGKVLIRITDLAVVFEGRDRVELSTDLSDPDAPTRITDAFGEAIAHPIEFHDHTVQPDPGPNEIPDGYSY